MRSFRLMRFAVAAIAVVGLASCSKRVKLEPAKLDFTLKDMNGHDVKLADFKGKPLIVNFFGVTCGPCQLETPELIDLAAKYKDRGLTIVGISIEDSPADIRAFAAQYKVPYLLLDGEDREDVQSALGLGDGIPTSVFINARGMYWGKLEGLGTQSFFDKEIQALF